MGSVERICIYDSLNRDAEMKKKVLASKKHSLQWLDRQNRYKEKSGRGKVPSGMAGLRSQELDFSETEEGPKHHKQSKAWDCGLVELQLGMAQNK